MTGLRRRWIPLLKIAYPSIADVAADWYFYDVISKDLDSQIQKYEIYVFIFFIVSASMGALTLLGLLYRGCCPGSKEKPSIFTKQRLDRLLGLEILLGDVPQLVLSALVAHRQNTITASTAFNFASSGYNLVYDALTMLEASDEDDVKDNGDGEPIAEAEPEAESEEFRLEPVMTA
jgi:hypothetical protein